MINWQSLQSAGLARKFANGAATLVVSAVPGKLYGVTGVSANASAIYLQIFDAPTVAAAESGGTWVTPPVLQIAVNVSSTLAPNENSFMPPIALATGCVMLLSTSGTGYVADTSPICISCSFAPDPTSTLGNTVPA